jgi:hypothetical protein
VFHPDHHHHTPQTYAEGVLLESSNAETWTPFNVFDLTMRLCKGSIFWITARCSSSLLAGCIWPEHRRYSAIPEGTGLV